MKSVNWTASHAVCVTEIDDEHQQIFEAISDFQEALSDGRPLVEMRKQVERLIASGEDHFAHEERLMRAARYGSLRWHKQQHDAARGRLRQFALRFEQGDPEAGPALVEYLKSWLHAHTRLADQMMGAFLRNEKRGLYRMTLQAGTKPREACVWVRANGDPVDPPRESTAF